MEPRTHSVVSIAVPREGEFDSVSGLASGSDSGVRWLYSVRDVRFGFKFGFRE